MSDLWVEAERLASGYQSYFMTHESLEDDSVVYLVHDTVLDGCRAQGKTSKEAIDNLNNARADFIHALLELGLPLPGTYRVAIECRFCGKAQ